MEAKLIMLPQPILVNSKPEEGISPHVTYFDDKVDENNIYIGSKMFSDNKTFKYIKGIDENNRTVYETIAGLPDLPKLELSLIAEGIGWVDVEKLAYQAAEKSFKRGINKWENKGIVKFFIDTYIEGFKASQSINEKKLFTLADIEEAWESGKKYGTTESEFWNTDSVSRAEYERCETKEDFIQSLSKPKEYNVQYVQEENTIKVTAILK